MNQIFFRFFETGGDSDFLISNHFVNKILIENQNFVIFQIIVSKFVKNTKLNKESFILLTGFLEFKISAD